MQEKIYQEFSEVVKFSRQHGKTILSYLKLLKKFAQFGKPLNVNGST
jgi:hypothetical protein